MQATTSRPPDAKGERYRCCGCTFGITVVSRFPPRCPMCHGRAWQPEPERRSQAVQ